MTSTDDRRAEWDAITPPGIWHGRSAESPAYGDPTWPDDPAKAADAIERLRARLLPTLEQGAGGGRRERDADLAQLLAATQAHELELLEEVSTAYGDGYSAAVAQLAGLLEWAFAEAPSDQLAGLAAALDLAGRLRPATHRVSLTADLGLIVLTLGCAAPVGAPCRVVCQGSLEGRCDDVCECVEPSLVDGGSCRAVEWLNDYDPPDFLDARVGRPDRELTSAPVAVRWSREHDAWQWMYADELPDGVSDEQWTRGQP